MKFTFNYKSSVIEKLIYFIVAITFVAPLMASLICFFCFTFLGLEMSQEFRYSILCIIEICSLLSFVMIYY